MTVTIRFLKEEDEVTFLLASREESGSPIDVYSPRSPLGAAIMGKKVGERATYSLPNGRATRSRSSRPYRTSGPDRLLNLIWPNGPWCQLPRPVRRCPVSADQVRMREQGTVTRGASQAGSVISPVLLAAQALSQ